MKCRKHSSLNVFEVICDFLQVQAGRLVVSVAPKQTHKQQGYPSCYAALIVWQRMDGTGAGIWTERLMREWDAGEQGIFRANEERQNRCADWWCSRKKGGNVRWHLVDGWKMAEKRLADFGVAWLCPKVTHMPAFTSNTKHWSIEL